MTASVVCYLSRFKVIGEKERMCNRRGKTQKYAHGPQALSYDCVSSEVLLYVQFG